MVVWIATAAFAWVCMMCQADCLQREAMEEDPQQAGKKRHGAKVATQILKAPFE